MKRTTTISRSAFALSAAAARLRGVAAKGLLFFATTLVLLGTAVSVAAQNPIGLIVADFNHDGIPDVLSPSTQTSSLTIAFGSVPYGTFNTVAKNVPYPAACANLVNNSVAVGDFNGDGIPDVVMACFGGQLQATTLFVLLGNGDGTFRNGVQLPGASNVVTGDFNHDGFIDIVTEGPNPNNQQTLTFYAGKGDGTFAAGVSSSLGNLFYSPMLAVDVNQDGYTDIVLGYLSSSSVNTIYVFGNNRDGTFGVLAPTSGIYAANTSVGVGSYPAVVESSILTGSYFNSGFPDLAIPDRGTSPGIYVLQNTSSGSAYSFAAAVKTTVTALQSAVTANFLTPGYSDFLVYNGTNLTVLTNNGKGAFGSTPYMALTLANTSPLFAAADANGDGYADVYTATTTATGVNVTVNLVSGSASASSAPFTLPAGTIPVAAAWPGNVNFSGATANGSQTVNPIASTVGLVSSLNPSLVGNNVTFTATVAAVGTGNPTPTGMVIFTDGSTSIGSSSVGQGGVATLSTTALSAGSHVITATYGGDAIFGGSSKTLTQQVNSNVPTITWATPVAIIYGTPLSATQLNATATNSGGTAIPGTFVYAPAAGTVLNSGAQTLTVTFTPTDQVTYTTASKTVSLQVNAAAPVISWTPALNSITYGTPLGAQQLNAAATGVGGVIVPGTFVYTPASGTVLGVGQQTLAVVFTPISTNYTVANGSAFVTVAQATPTITWPTPAAIAYGTPLSATQLNATATGVTGAALPGTFVYTPAAGAVLNPGTQLLSVTFTPTDAVDYAVKTATVNVTVTDLVLTSFTPNTATLGDPNKTITITGSGFVATTVAQLNGTAIATTLVNPTTLTAIIPAANMLAPATLQIALKNPATGTVTASLPFTVNNLPVGATLSGPATTPPGTQPTLNFTVPAYPVDLTATFTLSVKSGLTSGVTDPNVLFSNGQTTYSFVIKAGSTTVPTIQIQAGTVAGTITIPVVLTTSNGTVVTPANLVPVVIVVPPAVPAETAATLTRSGTQLTVVVTGYSNTRDVTQAHFHFVPAAGASLTTADFTADVTSVFATYFANPANNAFGSTFVYTQVFTVSDDASKIGSVQVTLTNSQGVSAAVTAQ